MEATLRGNNRVRGRHHPDLSYLPTQPRKRWAPAANTHTDSSACCLASAACCSRSFSATWACRSISLKLWLLTFWAPRPFLSPSWQNYVMRALPTTMPSIPSLAWKHPQGKGSFLKFTVKKIGAPSAWWRGRTVVLLELSLRWPTQPQQRPGGQRTTANATRPGMCQALMCTISLTPPRSPLETSILTVPHRSAAEKLSTFTSHTASKWSGQRGNPGA